MPVPITPLRKRFWSRVNKRGALKSHMTTCCWEWTGYKVAWGYGVVSLEGGRGAPTVRCHRLSWEWVKGPIPAGMFVLHKCDNPACIRPSHLFLGDAKDNAHDRMKKGRPGSPGGGKGEKNGRAKLTWKKVRKIRCSTGACKELARQNGVSAGLVAMIRRNEIWKE